MSEACPPIRLPDPLEGMANQLFWPDEGDIFGPQLTVVEAAGRPVVASIVAVSGRDGRDALSLRAAWREPDGTLGLSTHCANFCADGCYDVKITDRLATASTPAAAAELFGPDTPEESRILPGAVAAQSWLTDLLQAPAETDFLSLFGFNFDPWNTYFLRHRERFPEPLRVAIEHVRTQRGR